MTNFYLLGAGRPHSGDVHTALRAINNSSKVIDWNLNAISFLKPICHFVCGYQAEDIINLHPNLIYIENKEWETTKAGWSFLTAHQICMKMHLFLIQTLFLGNLL